MLLLESKHVFILYVDIERSSSQLRSSGIEHPAQKWLLERSKTISLRQLKAVTSPLPFMAFYTIYNVGTAKEAMAPS